MLVDMNKKKHITICSVKRLFSFTHRSFFFFHSIFEFVFTVFLSAVDASRLRDIPLLSSEFVEWTDCNSEGDCGADPL